MMMPLTWWQNEDEKNNKNFFSSYAVKLVNSCLLNMIMMREGEGDENNIGEFLKVRSGN